MFVLRLIAAFALFAAHGAQPINIDICKAFCASVNGGASYDTCSPWISFAKQSNKTCYNLCVNNCAQMDGSCMTDIRYKCCIATFPPKKQPYKLSGCNVLYDNLVF
uniref:Nematode Specific Peptide family, group C n=1 Tax=Caenorhabditis japonica TaxID=281687 RepID=A0A8R1E5E7_CAEJA